MKEQKYKFIAFDLDDTLIDYDYSAKYAFLNVLNSAGMRPQNFEAEYKNYKAYAALYWQTFENGNMPLLSKYYLQNTTMLNQEGVRFVRANLFLTYFKDVYGINMSLQEAERLFGIFTQKMGECVMSTDGTCKTLERLGQTHKMIVATNGEKISAQSKINMAGLGDYISAIISSDDIGVAKPNIKFFEQIFALAKCNPYEVLMVGDGINTDILGAIKAHMDTCYYNPHGKQIPKDIKPTYQIKNMQSLVDICLSK